MEYEQLGPLISELMPGATMASQLYAEALFHVGSHLEPITYSDLKSLIHKLVHPRPHPHPVHTSPCPERVGRAAGLAPSGVRRRETGAWCQRRRAS
jgi:hypothetical protein